MKVIGLCGGSGSGKGTVASCFLKRGIPSLDTDAIYHRLTDSPSPCLDELIGLFGKSILGKNGGLDRKALAEIVFASGGGKARRALNEITHRYVLQECRKEIAALRKKELPAVLIDAPLLFESGFDRECDLVIAVLADTKTRVLRVVARDGITEAEAKRRIAAQMPDEELAARADYLIRNDGSADELDREVASLIRKIL